MDPQDYDMTAAGFDGFMSRSIDSTPQINLDSTTPPNNAVAFDRTQVTGSQGDTYKMGGISMTGKDSTITLNDGQFIVEDRNQVGLAQFGRFKDGTTALKIAQPNIEVSTASNDQLIFNSSQNVFKIVSVLNPTYTLNNTNISNNFATITVNHGLGYRPIVLGSAFYGATGVSYQLPAFVAGQASYYGGAPPADFSILFTSIDTANIVLTLYIYNSNGTTILTANPTLIFKLYCLQESTA